MKEFLKIPNLFGKTCAIFCIAAAFTGMVMDLSYWGVFLVAGFFIATILILELS